MTNIEVAVVAMRVECNKVNYCIINGAIYTYQVRISTTVSIEVKQ